MYDHETNVVTEFVNAIHAKDFDKALAIWNKQSSKTIDEMLLPRLLTTLFDAIGNVQLLFTSWQFWTLDGVLIFAQSAGHL